ncbi:hypothetical protein AVEN_37709-1 [Araneus ventricosus]|uniref:Secreted protein n=1 Tax=Araneus ventricosus TaxID=182803 RepID=A0A4Y2BTH9_ARAVE|nr:hypothetical protein AVEN_37709-1 [Araneus ventricosus]
MKLLVVSAMKFLFFQASLVILTSRFEVTRGRDLITLNRAHTMKTTLEVAPLFPSFRATQAGRRLTQGVRFSVNQDHMYGRSSPGASFKTGSLRARAPDLATRPPRSPFVQIKLTFRNI